MANNYDVVIIGSRAGGGTLARQLAPSGKNVLILERADSLKREAENWDGTSVFVKNRYISPETFKSGFNIGFDIQTTKWVRWQLSLLLAVIFPSRISSSNARQMRFRFRGGGSQ